MISDLASFIAESVEKGGTPEEIARRACQEFQRKYGGLERYIPAVDRKWREQAIVEDVKKMKDRNEVAKKHGVHVSTVSRAVTRANQRGQHATGFGSDEWVL